MENGSLPGGDQDMPRDDEMQAFHNQIRAVDAEKLEFVGDKEPLSVLEEEYKAGSRVFLAKLQILKQKYGAIRRARGDGNCFFRSFMFSYLEHLLVTQDVAEVARMEKAIEICKKTLIDHGFAEFTFEDFLAIFVEQLQSVIQDKEVSVSLETLVERCRDQYISNSVVMFFRFVTSGEIGRRTEFFEPFIQGMSNMSVVQFRRSSVEPMGEESDHVHITALSDALGVPVRVVYLDQSGDVNDKPVIVNNHDFIPEGMDAAVEPNVILLYRPGHYDILYRKENSEDALLSNLEQTG